MAFLLEAITAHFSYLRRCLAAGFLRCAGSDVEAEGLQQMRADFCGEAMLTTFLRLCGCRPSTWRLHLQVPVAPVVSDSSRPRSTCFSLPVSGSNPSATVQRAPHPWALKSKAAIVSSGTQVSPLMNLNSFASLVICLVRDRAVACSGRSLHTALQLL